ncbi:hypothetical protein CAPTEDRAFT_212860 [Capitella teleta]|uniref:Uncharacterized protein n=1 Tax=Capitella teleta TaxID=283909 RepID=R7UYA1_CAPTE|nr:hypothetical protein CAPTEDRAFT_212860 [Capitella teleta]|eukprot:ELU11232.1 hypothetical protein CAPTEDRAFT_212860 [Capitella teleta]
MVDTDPKVALMCYKSTPLGSHLPSPAKLLYNRLIRSNIPARTVVNTRKMDEKSSMRTMSLDAERHYNRKAAKLMHCLKLVKLENYGAVDGTQESIDLHNTSILYAKESSAKMDKITQKVGDAVVGTADDLIVYGRDTEDHDQALHRLMQVVRRKVTERRHVPCSHPWSMDYPTEINLPETNTNMQPQAQPAMHAPMTQAPSEVFSEPRWSWCPMMTAFFGLILCWPLGVVALLAASTSYTDHKVKDFSRSSNKRSMALSCAIMAITVERDSFMSIRELPRLTSANQAEKCVYRLLLEGNDKCHHVCQYFKWRENWLKMDFESLFDATKMIPMPSPHKEYHC